MLNAIKRNKDLQRRLVFTIIILFIAQFVTNIPSPGINRDMIGNFFESDLGQSMGFFALFSGNALQNMSMFVLGISPYITASIVLQLLRVSFPKLDEIAKDGKVGADRFKRISYVTGGLFGIIQSVPVAYGFKKSGLLIENNSKYVAIVALFLILGSIIFIALGASIDKWGIENGISLILMTNIISRLPYDLSTVYDMYMKGKQPYMIATVPVIVIAVMVGLVIWTIYLQDGEKRIQTQYSGHVSGIKTAKNGGGSYLPLKVNIAGVMPIIFTMNMFQLYTLAVNLIGVKDGNVFKEISNALITKNWFNMARPWYTLGLILYVILLVAFQYFYSIIQFDTEKIANELKTQGGTIIGIRPGKPTQKYLDKKLKSMVIVGSILLFVVAIIPIFIAGICNMHSLSLGGTSIIIIVGVLTESYKKLESECLQNSQTSSFLW